MQIGTRHIVEEIETALLRFRQLYGTPPLLARCSPDVLDRYSDAAGWGVDAPRRREIRHFGIPLVAAVLPPNTIVIEGEIDEDRMGDW
jgi:hypothetical protein